ncbi:MAG: T9SS type A sorting domain-containing protein [Crocinitomicaceae bacterium]|nr:T9SS type A sorting domain-containing protein [Crocinitomicaceae bacterium]
MKWLLGLIGLFCLGQVSAQQDFDYFFIGDTTDVSPTTQFGVCLMGGAEENDDASAWFLQRANGGNIVVIRASGSDAYNTYFYEDLGVNVQSVETIIFNNANASLDAFVQRRLQNAEAIWIAGGDQAVYENYWKNTPIQDIINAHVNVKSAPIGGISAGMAILGGIYFSAVNGTINSADALANPMDNRIVLSTDFLNIPFLEDVITDTHYDNPDRRGRHVTFMARLTNDLNRRIYGIGANEYTAVCIADNGVATIFGDYPEFPDKVFFLQNSCQATNATIVANTPLTWLAAPNALYVYEANAPEDGNASFDLNTWRNASGGEWQYWNVENGTLLTSAGNAPDCALSANELSSPNMDISIFPNPAGEFINVKDLDVTDINNFVIYDLSGRMVKVVNELHNTIEISELSPGAYLLKIDYITGTKSLRFIKE